MQVDIEIEPTVAQLLSSEWPSSIESVAVKALHHQGVDAMGALTILLTDDETLHRLNVTHRQEDKPTDVLSFESGEIWPDGTHYLGDIAISLPTAARQAEQHAKSLLEEVELLTVHGILHLLGYDHAEPKEEAEMWRIQNEILI
ncbi:MAG: rRNA maturation RNase YbeY [Chloroflexota bacterium]